MNVKYTFVKGSNIPDYIQVGDTFTWMQMRPLVGSYGYERSGGPPKEITGVVVAIRDDMWVDVEAEAVHELGWEADHEV